MTTPTAPPDLDAPPSFPALSDRTAGTYNSKAFAWATSMTDTFAPQLIALAANLYANSVVAYNAAGTATTKAEEAADSATAAAAWATSLTAVEGGYFGARYYALQAAQAVASLPSGTINDATSSATNTYSSNKINTLIADKQAKITVSGLLKGDGSGGLTTAQSGTDIKTVNGESILGVGNIIVSSGAGEDGSAFLPSLIKQTANAVVPTSLSGSSTRLCAVIELDTDRTFLMIGKDSGLWGVIHSNSAGFGTSVLIRAGSIYNNARATQHSTTEILVVSCPIGSVSVQAVILTVTGSTIVVNTAASGTSNLSTATAGFGEIYEGNYGIVKVGSTYCVARYVSGNTPEITSVTVSGTTCTMGFTTVSGVTASACPILYESGGYLLVFTPRDPSGYSYYTTYSVAGTALTVVTSTTVLTSYQNSTIAKMQSNTFLTVYGAGGGTVRARTLTMISGAATLSTEVSVLVTNGTGDAQPRVIRISDTKAAVCGNYPSANIIAVGANSCVAGTQVDLSGGSGPVYALGAKNGIAYFSSNYGVIRVSDNAGQPSASNETFNFSPTGYSQATTQYSFNRPPTSVLVGTNYLTSANTSENLTLAFSENYAGLVPNTARIAYIFMYSNQNNTSVWSAAASSQATTRLTRLTIA